MSSHRTLAALLVAPLALTACARTDATPTRADTQTAAAKQLAFPLPARSHLAARARAFRGPRVGTESTHGRTLTMYGTAKARQRLLVAGCVNGTRCAGTDVVNAALLGCPPTDAELWFFDTLEPRGADLDAVPAHAGARAFRQAVADLRPTVAIEFRTGPRALVHAAGASATKGRRYARIAGLPFTPTNGEGLAPWAATALPRHRRDHGRAAARPRVEAPRDPARVRDRPPLRHALRDGRVRRAPPRDRVRRRSARFTTLNRHSFVTFAC